MSLSLALISPPSGRKYSHDVGQFMAIFWFSNCCQAANATFPNSSADLTANTSTVVEVPPLRVDRELRFRPPPVRTAPRPPTLAIWAKASVSTFSVLVTWCVGGGRYEDVCACEWVVVWRTGTHLTHTHHTHTHTHNTHVHLLHILVMQYSSSPDRCRAAWRERTQSRSLPRRGGCTPTWWAVRVQYVYMPCGVNRVLWCDKDPFTCTESSVMYRVCLCLCLCLSLCLSLSHQVKRIAIAVAPCLGVAEHANE